MKRKLVLLFCFMLLIIFFVLFALPKTEEIAISVDVYENVNLSSIQEKISCTLKSDVLLDTSQIGTFQLQEKCYFGIKKGQVKVTVNVEDHEAPILFLNDTFTVTEGYDKNLMDVILSADNYDSTPEREIIGDYDVNQIGSYDLRYIIKDQSNNVTQKDFTLNVVSKKTSTNTSKTKFEDVLNNYKTASNEIGIDVSKWQGDIDFEKVKNAGATFVMIRLGYQNGYGGDYVIDPYFKQNLKNAKMHGLKVGVYFYTYAKEVKDAKNQAKWIAEVLNGESLDLPVAYDWENWSSFNSLNLNLYEFNNIAKTFMSEVKKYGYESMLYSSKNYLEKIWNVKDDTVTWLAHYTDQTNYTGKYQMWQICDNGIIDGIKGYVDIDILYP